MSSNMQSYSIYEELTIQKDAATPNSATKVIDRLVRSLAYQACKETRGAQTYYRIVSRARCIADDINEIICDVEKKKDWVLYDLYNSQIEPLEKLLHYISRLVLEKREGYQLEKVSSIEECLDSIKYWQGDRYVQRDVSKNLHLPPFMNPDYDWNADLIAAGHHDDLSWISTICNAIIEALEPLVPKIEQKPGQVLHITSVIEHIAEIQELLETAFNVEDDTMVFSTRCLTVMHGVISLAFGSSGVVDPEVRRHLNARKTWDFARSLTGRLRDMLYKPSQAFDWSLQKDWDEYERYLLNPKDSRKEVNEILDELITYPCKIDLPYRARSLALVKLCLKIGRHPREGEASEEMKRLEEVVEVVIEAMKKCIELAEKSENLDEYLKEPIIDCDAVDVIRAFYSDFMIDAPHTVDEEMSNAIEKDQMDCALLREHAKRLENHGIPVDAMEGPYGEDLNFELHIFDSVNKPERSTRYSMASGGDVDAILWSFTSPLLPSNRTTLDTRPRVYGVEPNKEIQPGKLKQHPQVFLIRNTKAEKLVSPLRRFAPRPSG